MFGSKGIKRGAKPAEESIDLDRKLEEWTAEFGPEQGKQLHAVVMRETENYEYLKERKTHF
ncbi:uncharacterized protein LTR77_009662 [Saxophila tyrrhenica]|uniref:Uncharacterized protein n=1 Tax=Saxophila tyrrhenica TaxID=1690608 RepID=A0AAV9NX73_9PEZI|nr:hypothetical protein LTR77_009662 [Saxophila tyrrhenica]